MQTTVSEVEMVQVFMPCTQRLLKSGPASPAAIERDFDRSGGTSVHVRPGSQRRRSDGPSGSILFRIKEIRETHDPWR
jgi:hypothetical protein